MSIFRYGVDYYPEHWPEERWESDARLMAEAGMNVVRLAEFAWAKMEPREGEFDFAWLDRALEVLHKHGIQAILGTPTASPPPWVMGKDESLYRVRQDGRRLTFGNRREYCPSHPLFRELSRKIVDAMAEHYRTHPAVIGWQIDNEFGDRCYCAVCAAEFQGWLQKRYPSLQALNQAWGTIFWSHVYSDWAEIPVPLSTGGAPNPGLALDFARFSSDSYVGYQQMQVDILRKRCPKHFITHNFMGFGYEQLNYFDLARGLDLVTWDNYPRGFWNIRAEVDPSHMALGHDAMRSLKHQNFWMMEQQSGTGGWETMGVTPRPGEMRLWAYQAIAHGADGMVFFRWRTARFGTEEYWHGILDHHAQPKRRYQEAKQLGQELGKFGESLLGAAVRPQAGMLLAYDTRWGFQIQPNNPKFNYSAHFWQYYKALYKRQIGVELVAPEDDFSAYKLLVVPALYILPTALADKLSQYVKKGGVLVVTARSGVKDEYNTVVDQVLPGLLREVCGVEVEEYDSLAEDMFNPLKFDLPELSVKPASAIFAMPDAQTQANARTWCEVLEPAGATAAAHYTQEYYAGRAAVTINKYGKGKAIYVGCLGDESVPEALADWLLNLAGLKPALKVPEGVEVCERWQDKRRLLFVLNHQGEEKEITLPAGYTNLLTGQALNGTAKLAGRDVLILMEAAHD